MVYNTRMLIANTAKAHNSILAVAVRALLAIFTKATVLAVFALSCSLMLNANAQIWGFGDTKGTVDIGDTCQENPDERPLVCAELAGDVEKVKELLVNRGYTPLQIAAFLGNEREVFSLVAKGAKITVRGKDGNAIEIAENRRGKHDTIAIFLRDVSNFRAERLLLEYRKCCR